MASTITTILIILVLALLAVLKLCEGRKKRGYYSILHSNRIAQENEAFYGCSLVVVAVLFTVFLFAIC